jgi:hypothetical protein
MLTSGTPWFYGRSSGRALGGAAVTLCTALLAAAPAAAQSLTYGPLLGRGHTPDQSIVRWGTGAATDATSVAYRKKGAAMWQLQSGGAARDHEVILTGLAPGETYEYEVRSLTGTPEGGAFTTCPQAGRPMDFVFYGDSRTGFGTMAGEHAKVLMQVARKTPEMVFESGDIVPNGTYSQYLNEFFPVAKDLLRTTPFMAAPGNHDAISDLSANYGAVFPSPRASGAPWQSYYSFTCGNALFLSLDSNKVSDADQLKFLTTQLELGRGDRSIEHVFVWLHHAPYSVGSHGDNTTVQSKWVPIFNRPEYKVTAVFAGHDHLYARLDDSSQVVYVVSGGAGANLYSDSGTSKAKKVISKMVYNFVSIHLAGLTMSAVAYDDTGTEIDRFAVTKTGAPPDGGGADGGPVDVIDAGAKPDLSGGVDGGAQADLAMPTPPAGGCTLAAPGSGGPARTPGWGTLLLLGLCVSAAAARRARASRLPSHC